MIQITFNIGGHNYGLLLLHAPKEFDILRPRMGLEYAHRMVTHRERGVSMARRYVSVCYLTVKLPDDVLVAWALKAGLEKVMDRATNLAVMSRGLCTLHWRITRNLGLAYRIEWPAEWQWLGVIANDPGNRENWHAYSDWLMEQGDEAAARGEYIKKWLSPRRFARLLRKVR